MFSAFATYVTYAFQPCGHCIPVVSHACLLLTFGPRFYDDFATYRSHELVQLLPTSGHAALKLRRELPPLAPLDLMRRSLTPASVWQKKTALFLWGNPPKKCRTTGRNVQRMHIQWHWLCCELAWAKVLSCNTTYAAYVAYAMPTSQTGCDIHELCKCAIGHCKQAVCTFKLVPVSA